MKHILIYLLFLLPIVSGFSNNEQISFCDVLNKRDLTEISKQEERICKINESNLRYKYTDYSNILTKFRKYNLNFKEYSDKLSYLESRGKYTAVNKFTNCLGKYQFKHTTLVYLKKKGILNIGSNSLSPNEFLKNKELQEASIAAFTFGNLNTLERLGYLDYVGKEVNGIEITVSGLLGAAHLGGVGGVKKFLKLNVDNADIHNTSVSKYMKLMS